MPRKLIVGYDGSDRARDALELGRRLVYASGADMVLANVYHAPSPMHVAKREAERVLFQAPAGVRAELRAVGASSPARGLHDLAEDLNAEYIVIGSTHRGGLGLIEPGSAGEHLLHGAACGVAVAPVGFAQRSTTRPGRLAVGCNGTPESLVALEAGIDFARRLAVSLRLIAAVEPRDQLPHVEGNEESFAGWLRGQRERDLAEAMALVPDDVGAEAVIVEGMPVDVLRDLDDVDLLLLGSGRYGRIRGALLGSVSAKVIRGAKAPVLVVPSRREPGQPAPAHRELAATHASVPSSR